MAGRSRKHSIRVLAVLACIALVMGLMPIPALADPAEAPEKPNPDTPTAAEPADETTELDADQAEGEKGTKGAEETKEPASPTEKTTKSDDKATKTTETKEKKRAASSAKGAGDSKPKLTITAKDQSYTYNGSTQGEGDPVIEDNIDSKITAKGLQSGDKIAMIVIDGARKDVGKQDIEVTGCKVTNANNEDVTENYDITYVKGTLTINKKTVTVTTGSATKKYDGKALTNTEASIKGLVKGETATVTATGSQTNAGNSKNTYSIKWDTGTDKNNYTVKEKLGKLTVKRAEATITVNNASKVEGKSDPAFTGTVKGLVKDGDLGKVEYVRTGNDKTPGTYKGVLTAKYTPNDNYKVKVVKGNFTITKASTNSTSKSTTPKTGDSLANMFMPFVALAAISGLCLALSGTALRRCRNHASSGEHDGK